MEIILILKKYLLNIEFVNLVNYTNYMKSWTPKQIEFFRKKHALSRQQLGNLLGVTRIYIHYLEKGEKTPSKTLRLLLDCVEEKLKKGK